MVYAGGGKHERLPGGTKSGRKPREDRLAQRLCAGRTAGLARANHIEAQRREALLKPLRLHRLPGALAPFEGDEPAPRPPGHWRAFGRGDIFHIKPSSPRVSRGCCVTPSRLRAFSASFGAGWQRRLRRDPDCRRSPGRRLQAESRGCRLDWKAGGAAFARMGKILSLLPRTNLPVIAKKLPVRVRPQRLVPARVFTRCRGLSIRGQRGFYALQPIERAGRGILASAVSGLGEVERLLRARLQIGTARRHDDALGR